MPFSLILSLLLNKIIKIILRILRGCISMILTRVYFFAVNHCRFFNLVYLLILFFIILLN
jgi:hypothetical protein